MVKNCPMPNKVQTSKILFIIFYAENLIAVILSLFWVYSDSPTRSYKSLDLGYGQKPFLGYFPKYFMEMPKIFFVCFSPIEKHENVKKLKYFAKKNIFYGKFFFSSMTFRDLYKPNHRSKKINSNIFGKRTV